MTLFCFFLKIVLMSLCAAHKYYFTEVKRLIFPNPYSFSQRRKDTDPSDAPPNTLRCELLRLMISIDVNVKRLVAELLFALSNNDGTD
jgi:hypothetical protein